MTEPIRPQKITIQRGEGLTQALQKLVRSMPNSIMTDGGISASEWDATMDALVEIQNERKNNGSKAIFSGGTDKTKSGWKNSFVVQAGQVIEFTAAEMTKLFKAMGVEVNPAPAGDPPAASPTDPPATPPAAETPTEPPAEPPVTSEIPEVVTPPPYNPPADDPNPPRDGQPQLALAQHLIPSNEQFPDRAGQVKKEGPLFNRRTVTYDVNGYITMVETKYYTLKIERGADGEVLVHKKTSIVDKQERTDYYNNTGEPIGYYATSNLDDNGRKFRNTMRNSETGEVESYSSFERNDAGEVTRWVVRDASGEVIKSWEYEYDEHNRETQYIYRDADGNIICWIDVIYDEEGNVTIIKRNPDGTIQEDE